MICSFPKVCANLKSYAKKCADAGLVHWHLRPGTTTAHATLHRDCWRALMQRIDARATKRAAKRSSAAAPAAAAAAAAGAADGRKRAHSDDAADLPQKLAALPLSAAETRAIWQAEETVKKNEEKKKKKKEKEKEKKVENF